jgi:hypothetical protein
VATALTDSVGAAAVTTPYQFGDVALTAGAATVAELAGTARQVVSLVLALPARMAAAGLLGPVLADVDEDWLDFVLDPPDGLDGCLSRPDLIYSGGRFRCVDVNAAHAGGWLAGLWWARHGDDAGPPGRDPLAAVFDLVHDRARRRGVAGPGEPVCLAVIRAAGSAEFAEPNRLACLPAWRAAAERAGATPGVFRFTDYADLDITAGEVRCRGERVHALVEGDVIDGAPRMRCVALAKAGLLSLHSGPVAAVVNDRRMLAELSRSADAGAPLLTAAERRLIRDAVPWTRSLLPGTTHWRGRPVRLPEVVVERRTELVVKQVSSAGGTHVYLGRYTPAGVWRDLVASACASGDWVVQEFLPPEYPPVVSPAEPGTHPVWGAFVVGGRYAGSLVRLLGAHDYHGDGPAPTSVATSHNGDDHVRLVPVLDRQLDPEEIA